MKQKERLLEMASEKRQSQIWKFGCGGNEEHSATKTNFLEAKSLDDLRVKLQNCWGEQNGANCEQVLDFGIFCLENFVQSNFYGPVHEESVFKEFLNDSSKDEIFNELSADGISCNKNVTGEAFLAAAKWIFAAENAQKVCPDCPTVIDWWRLRVVLVWQTVLLETSQSLKENFEILTKKASESHSFELLDKDLRVLFWLEIASGHLLFYDHAKAEIALQNSLDLSDLSFELTGALGKRTKFQQKDVAQLKFLVHSPPTGSQNSSSDAKSEKVSSEGFLPKNCLLNDEVILDGVAFSSEEHNEKMDDLTSLDQCVILAMTKLRWRVQPKSTALLHEEIKTYVEKLLEKPKDPSVQRGALYLRCKVEKSESRRIERALAQSEQLSKEFEERASGSKSSGLVFAAGLVPVWNVRKMHADLLADLGINGEALGIYEKLECWAEVIECYKSLGKLDYAEHIIRNRLKEEEDPVFLCLLGGITSNPEHYERAWEGCCAMELKRWDEAAKAFRRCTNIEPDNFEAWNNLAAAYMHSRQVDKAFRTLQETLRYNYENWKVWDNYMGVCTQLGNFKESIRSYHRLLDLKPKYTDTRVLGALVLGAKMKPEPHGDIQSLEKELRGLFGRLTGLVTGDPEIWRLYGRLIEPESDASLDEWEKYVKTLQRAHQSGVQTQNWERNETSCSDILRTAEKLAMGQMKILSMIESEERQLQIRSSVRLMVKGLLGRVNKHWESRAEMNEGVMKLCESLKEILERLT